MIGEGRRIAVFANPAILSDHAVLAVEREGYECSTCRHQWFVGPEAPLLTGPVCDFCCEGEPVTGFPCRDFAIVNAEGPNARYDGGWAACRECAELVEADSRERLVDRSVESFIRQYPAIAATFPPGQLTCDIRRRHRGFWTYRITEEADTSLDT
jgi:hypothetical protein